MRQDRGVAADVATARSVQPSIRLAAALQPALNKLLQQYQLEINRQLAQVAAALQPALKMLQQYQLEMAFQVAAAVQPALKIALERQHIAAHQVTTSSTVEVSPSVTLAELWATALRHRLTPRTIASIALLLLLIWYINIQVYKSPEEGNFLGFYVSILASGLISVIVSGGKKG